MTWEIDESRRKKEIVMAAMVRRERGGGWMREKVGFLLGNLEVEGSQYICVGGV